ncbi:PucR family transcriptional regulator ligand-binding domain-containing protein [Oceanobacillus sp. FSL K6-2867]|uniref:PucR family transcriptional regulator n=1 Tax=Oceanobacillus sp. FSL K6-2867 TaxID=2954748 RepID=UPI0030DAD39D
MSLSLRNAMKLGKFSECEIVAGHQGLARIIENITIMEVPDIIQWLKGKELILTSLFAIKDDLDAQNMLVQQLHNSGASGLAIKTSRYIQTIPDEIINTANRLGFPVIIIPDHVKYLDILSPVMHHVFNDKVVLQEDLDQATKILHEISLHSQSIDDFRMHVSNLTKNMITIESEFPFIELPDLEKSITPLSERQIDELSVIQRPMQYEREIDRKAISCIVAPIIVDKQYYGNITCWEVNNKHLSTDLAILERASSLLSLEFLKLKVKYDVEQQYKNDFIRELLFSENMKAKNLIEWGDKYRITRQDAYRCLLIRAMDRNSAEEMNVELKGYRMDAIIQRIIPGVLIGHISKGICIILPALEDREHLCHKILEVLSKDVASTVQLHLGVGRLETGPEGIQQSYVQAEQALRLGISVMHTQEILYYDDLGSYRLLSKLKDDHELLAFYDETVGRLLPYDTRNELLNTLTSYFYNDEILKLTANDLFIHVNTLKYRIKRIEELTGHDLKKSEGKMNLYLGLKIHRLLYSDKQ